MPRYELEPRYDARASFYNKAHVETADTPTTNSEIKLISYTTHVASIHGGVAEVFGLYSNTTTRHIKEFLKQHGFVANNSKQIMADYGKVKS